MVLKKQMAFPGDKGLQSFASAEQNWRFNICIVKFKRRAPGGAACQRLAWLCLAGGTSPGCPSKASTHRDPRPAHRAPKGCVGQTRWLSGALSYLVRRETPTVTAFPSLTLTVWWPCFMSH